MTENGGGKERNIFGRPTMVNEVRDGWKELKHEYLQTESTIKNLQSCNLSKEPIVRYSRLAEIMYSHSEHVPLGSYEEYMIFVKFLEC
jgi:hypothetical protein